MLLPFCVVDFSFRQGVGFFFLRLVIGINDAKESFLVGVAHGVVELKGFVNSFFEFLIFAHCFSPFVDFNSLSSTRNSLWACNFLEQFEMIFAIFYNAFLFEFAYFGGKSASLNLKVVGKLLAVKCNFKAVFAGFARLY